jgi:hypothetical protein
MKKPIDNGGQRMKNYSTSTKMKMGNGPDSVSCCDDKSKYSMKPGKKC